MPATRRRSASISKDSIEQASTALQQLPEKPKENLSLREAIAALSDTITTALDRGYSYEEVALMLSDQGVRISPTSLKSYLSESQRGKSSKTRRTMRRPTSASVALAPEEPSTDAEAVDAAAVAETSTRGRRRRSTASSESAPKSTPSRRSTARAKSSR